MTPLSKNLENEIVLINANIPKTNIASKNAFVANKMEIIAMVEIINTPITSNAITRSGMDGPTRMRINVIMIAIPNKISDIDRIVSIIYLVTSIIAFSNTPKDRSKSA